MKEAVMIPKCQLPIITQKGEVVLREKALRPRRSILLASDFKGGGDDPDTAQAYREHWQGVYEIYKPNPYEDFTPIDENLMQTGGERPPFDPSKDPDWNP